MDTRTELTVKLVLSLVAVAVILLRHRRPGRLRPEQAGQLLGLVAVVAVLAWANFGRFHGAGGIHHWEQFHYFLGAKYFPELRYDGLYIASVTAERELGGGAPVQSHLRDLRSNEVVPVETLADHARVVKARFSTARWREFSADTAYFLERNNYEYLTRIRRDHGYNPTPTWTFTARLFARWGRASDGFLAALAWLDGLLLAALFVVIFRTYGSRIGCMSLVIFGLGYPWRFDWVGGAFLRQDWLAAAGIAVCLHRGRRAGAAGFLIAYATMVRVFPGGFLIGGAILALRALVARQRPTWSLRLAAGFAAGVAACLVAGCLTGAGPAAWPEFAHNLDKHHDTWLTNNVGLKNTLLYDRATLAREVVRWNLAEPWIIWQAKMNQRQAARRPLPLAASALLLLFIGAAAWQLAPDQAAVLGVAVAFAAVVLTCYYWVMLLLVPLGRGRWGPTVGWLGVNVGLYALALMTGSFEMIYGMMSWALAAFFVIWLAPPALATVRELRGWLSQRRPS